MHEITGSCSACNTDDLLNVKGGICFRCWSDLTVLEQEQIEAEEE